MAINGKLPSHCLVGGRNQQGVLGGVMFLSVNNNGRLGKVMGKVVGKCSRNGRWGEGGKGGS